MNRYLVFKSSDLNTNLQGFNGWNSIGIYSSQLAFETLAWLDRWFGQGYKYYSVFSWENNELKRSDQLANPSAISDRYSEPIIHPTQNWVAIAIAEPVYASITPEIRADLLNSLPAPDEEVTNLDSSWFASET